MSHYALHSLTEEPFSNSPNPDFFFRVPGRLECLDLLEISIRLRRGLSIVIGEVGTGKTTLCRQLVRRLGQDDAFRIHALLDPQFTNVIEFLKVLHAMFCGKEPAADSSLWKIKESIKNELFRLSVEHNAIVVLLVDEGQKIRDDCLELLRELLNYETNENKLLQIVIFGQTEFNDAIQRFPNLLDRIDALHTLKPLSRRETRRMIQARLEQVKGADKRPELFTRSGYWAVFRATRGYPRKILNLCHKVHLELILRGKPRANWRLVNACRQTSSQRNAPGAGPALRWSALALFLGFAGVLGLQSGLGGLLDVSSGVKELHAAGRHAERAYAGMAGSDPVVLAEFSKDNPPEAPQTPAPAATPASAATSPTAASAELPEMLGTLLLVHKEILERTVARVYGAYNERFMQAVLAANPEITNPNFIAAGSVLRFPRIESLSAANIPPVYWVVVGEFDTLEAAYAMLCTSAYRYQAIRILCRHSPQEGFRFSLVLNKTFPDEALASLAASRLPNPILGRVVIRNQWPAETVFFSAPEAMDSRPGKKRVLAARR